MLVNANDNWRYRLGNTPPPNDWQQLVFDDSSWRIGEGSIGYADGDDATIIEPVSSLYMRHTFTVADIEEVSALVFFADYDDGFVAYLNGVEIARANLEGMPPAHDQSTIMYREAEMYEGGLPEKFTISSDLLQITLQEGENVLAIQTNNFNGQASSDLTTLYWLILGLENTTDSYRSIPPWASNQLEFSTPLPIIVIDTEGAYIPNEPAILGTMGIIWNGSGNLNLSSDSPNELFSAIDIERRGQSSLLVFPKNGYAIETKDINGEDTDVSFLGFPEEEDWVLHGPYSDKTLIRNTLAMGIARSMGQYASRTQPVELVINDQYEGMYLLMEKIKRDGNRVDIAKLRAEDIAGDELTGGYVFKIDKGPPDWLSRYNMVNNSNQRLGFQFVSPNRNNIQAEQAAYIQAYMDSFEVAIRFPQQVFGGKYYYDYMDITSFADHFLHSELTKNVDAYRISSYFYKDKDSNDPRIKAGPAWDYNLAFGNADGCDADTDNGWMYYEHCGFSNPFWWQHLLEEPLFRNTLKCRWLELRETVFSDNQLNALIDEAVMEVRPAVERNFERWPVLGRYVWPNPIVHNTYEEEVEYLRTFLLRRLAWMDNNMFGTCLSTTLDAPIKQEVDLRIIPNPNKGIFDIVITTNGKLIQYRLIDIFGRRLYQSPTMTSNTGTFRFSINRTDLTLTKGTYWLQLMTDGEVVQVEKVVVL